MSGDWDPNKMKIFGAEKSTRLWKWKLVFVHGGIRAATDQNVTRWQRFWTWFFFGPAIKWERVENNEI